MRTFLRSLIAAFVATSLVACGSGSGDDDGDSTVVVPASSDLVGLWDDSRDGDELYVEISPDFTTTIWDYLGDVSNGGPDCFERIGPFDLVVVGDGLYDLQLLGESIGSSAIRLRRDGDFLVASDVNGMEEERSPLAGVSTVDFALCTDEQLRTFYEGETAATFDDATRGKRIFGTTLSIR